MRLRSLLAFAVAVVLPLAVPGAAPAASGGAAYGDSGSLPYSASSHPGSAGGSGRPVLRSFSVPARAQTGAPVVLRYRIDGTARTVRVRLTAVQAGEHHAAYNLNLGNHRTGRTVRYRWASAPAPGRYTLLLHVVDPSGMRLATTSRASSRAALRVVAAPAPVSPPAPDSGTAPVVTQPAPAATPAGLPGVFPVRGPHGFGGADARFGAGRTGHTHQGQDVTAAEGTPLVAPRAGTVTWTAYQATGAGYYVVIHDDAAPRDYVFMHLEKASTLVSKGQHVTAGQQIGRVGATGDADGPHLHFELWVGGWWVKGGAPVDPLPQLELWDR